MANEIKKFSVRFFISENGDYRIKGAMPLTLKSKGWDSFIPNFTPAHDILEHGKGEFGALYQELQAFGAVLYVRDWVVDEGWYVGQCRSEQMGGEMCSAYRDSAYSYDKDLLTFPTFPKFSLPREDKERFEEFFVKLRANVHKAWEREFSDEEDENFFLANWEQVKTAMMYGYYKSLRRWEGRAVYSLFRRINEVMLDIEKKALEMSEYNSNLVLTLKCEVGNYYSKAWVEMPEAW